MICPLDFRYGRKEMLSVFDESAHLSYMLKVEAALASSQARYGLIPKEAAKAIEKAVDAGLVKTERVREIEAEIGHDVMAMVKALSEVAGAGAGYVHYGATSNDIIDTASALQLKEAIRLIKGGLVELETVLARRALEEKDTVMLGRTHGQAALPVTFGLKLATFLSEIDRHFERVLEAEKRIEVGKVSGAVGTAASLGKNYFDVQDDLSERLDIGMELASGQIVGRDRYAELVTVLSNLASTLEKMATEVRNLQRTEIDEVEEHFNVEKQVGSSTMAQKRNPVIAENICGLARIVRGFVGPAFENMILWHERDLTNSSSERILIPHVCVLVDDILWKSISLFDRLEIKRENMSRNLERVKGLIMSERVLLYLTPALGRQQAHELVRQAAMSAVSQGIPFEDALLANKDIAAHMSREEVKKLLNPYDYTGQASRITEMVVTRVRNKRGIKQLTVGP
ncbi:MAG: adenylosuccinate lyase [Methanomassiliicoccales archaeon]